MGSQAMVVADSGVDPPSEETDEPVIVVARGQLELIHDISALFTGVGRVRIVEDRRRDRTLLPRERHCDRRGLHSAA
jgi:hypothetical protein